MNSTRKTSSSRKATQTSSATPALTLDYKELLRLCRKHWKIIAATFTAGLVGSIFYAATQTSIYSSQATIFVPDKETKGDSLNNVGSADARSGDLLKTYEQLLETRDLTLRVVKSLQLESNSQFLGNDFPVSEERAADILTGERTIHIRGATRLIDISVEHPAQKMAQALADEFARQAVQQDIDRSTGGAVTFSQQLSDQIKQVADEVQTLDQAVADYREKAHGISLESSQDTVDSTLQELNKEYNAAQSNLIQMQQRYLDSYPKLIEAKEAVAALAEQLHKQQQDALALNRASIGYHDLQAQADAKRIQYHKLLDVLSASQVAEKVELPSISIIEPAQYPYAPIRPNKKKIVAMGGFGGLIVGLAIICGIYFLDRSAKSVAQVEHAFSLPVLAAVPILTEKDLKETRIPTFTHPEWIASECFRSLRATLFLHDKSPLHRSILISSAIPGEGKTFCSVNLAIVLAQAGLRTVVIDADMRRSTLLGYFDPTAHEKKPPGLSDVLMGHASLSSVLIKSEIENLSILASGTKTKACAELLSGTSFTDLLAEVAKNFDRVVIDSAPLNAVSDSLLIIQKVDAALFVIRAGMTPISETKAALAKFSKSGVEPLGIILNHTQPHAMQIYDYGYL